MIEQRKVIAVLIGGLVLCATIHADMMPAFRQDSGCAQSLSVSTGPFSSTPVCPARSMAPVSLTWIRFPSCSCLFQAMMGDKPVRPSPCQS